MVVGNSLTFLILLLVTVLSFVNFTKEELIVSLWPTLNLLKLIQFPFLERWEIIFLSFYLYVLLMTVIPYLYHSLFFACHLFRKKDHRPFLLGVLGFWFLISSMYAPSYHGLDQLIEKVATFYVYGVFGFPFLLWILSLGYEKWQRFRDGVRI